MAADSESDCELPPSVGSDMSFMTESLSEHAELPPDVVDDALTDSLTDVAHMPSSEGTHSVIHGGMPLDTDHQVEPDGMHDTLSSDSVSMPSAYEEGEWESNFEIHNVPLPASTTQLLQQMGSERQDIAEFYSPPRLVPAARRRGFSGVFSLDIKTGWDLSEAANQKLSLDILLRCQVVFLMLSPPCTSFSRLMYMNWPRMTAEAATRMKDLGLSFLRHAMQAARIQVAHGRLFAFEHPASASSWQEDCVTEVANMPGVMKVTFDQCQFGFVTPVLRTPMKKPT